jgi:hypothetical protein
MQEPEQYFDLDMIASFQILSNSLFISHPTLHKPNPQRNNSITGSTKGGDITNRLSDYQLPNSDSAVLEITVYEAYVLVRVQKQGCNHMTRRCYGNRLTKLP